MTASRLAAACVDLLGEVPGPVAVVAPDAPAVAAALRAQVATAADSDAPTAAIVVFVGERGAGAVRAGFLRRLHARLPAGAIVALADHNQPRGSGRRGLNALALRLRGMAGDRARYPAARELQDCGFVVECLRLDPGESLQLVRARRA